MTDIPARRADFSPRLMIGLVLVGIFAFSGFTVLSVYAPELRAGQDGQAHALSRSAIGFAGAVTLLQARGTPVVVSRSPLTRSTDMGSLRVLTPGTEVGAKAYRAYDHRAPLLIVLPKWNVAPDPKHVGWVRRVAALPPGEAAAAARGLDPSAAIQRRKGPATAALHGAGGAFGVGTYLPIHVENLQAISGPRWRPVLVDDEGRMILASLGESRVMVLADPDLLNTQGLKSLDNARAGLAILDVLRGEGGVAFDVTLNGFKRSRSVLRLLFEPPLLGGLLCALAALLLMGVRAAVRFGPTAASGRAYALGKRALIDNSADLIRAARKEHELAVAYASLTESLTAKAVGEREADPAARAERLLRLEQRLAPKDALEALKAAAKAASTRAETLSVAARLFQWKAEMTHDR